MKSSSNSSIIMPHLVKKQAAGSLTITEFCRRHQIKPNRFFYWKKKIKEREAESGSSSRKDFSPASFIPLSLPAMAGGEFGDKIELHFPSGLRAGIPISTGPVAIRTIIKACGK